MGTAGSDLFSVTCGRLGGTVDRPQLFSITAEALGPNGGSRPRGYWLLSVTCTKRGAPVAICRDFLFRRSRVGISFEAPVLTPSSVSSVQACAPWPLAHNVRVRSFYTVAFAYSMIWPASRTVSVRRSEGQHCMINWKGS